MPKIRRGLAIVLCASALLALVSIVLLPRIGMVSSEQDPSQDAVESDAARAMDTPEDDQYAIETAASALTTSSFLRDALQLSRLQLLAAEIAMERAGESKVTAIAERIATDHKRIATNLSNRAVADRLDQQQRLPNKYRAQLATLRKASDSSFDRVYVSNAIETHQALLSLFRAASNSPAITPELGIYARDTLHVLNAHEKELQDLSHTRGS